MLAEKTAALAQLDAKLELKKALFDSMTAAVAEGGIGATRAPNAAEVKVRVCRRISEARAAAKVLAQDVKAQQMAREERVKMPEKEKQALRAENADREKIRPNSHVAAGAMVGQDLRTKQFEIAEQEKRAQESENAEWEKRRAHFVALRAARAEHVDKAQQVALKIALEKKEAMLAKRRACFAKFKAAWVEVDEKAEELVKADKSTAKLEAVFEEKAEQATIENKEAILVNDSASSASSATPAKRDNQDVNKRLA